MDENTIRQELAAAAARLLQSGAVRNLVSARRDACRKVLGRRPTRSERPSLAEIEVALFKRSGLFQEEHAAADWHRMERQTLQLLALLERWRPHVCGAAADRCGTDGAEVEIDVLADAPAEITQALTAVARDLTVVDDADGVSICGHCELPFRIRIRSAEIVRPGLSSPEFKLLAARPDEASARDADEPHPDTYGVMEALLAPLARIRGRVKAHPEGDLLYHSLQVFELGRGAFPYDAEFLEACLLHDVGWAIHPKLPDVAAVEALGDLITPRTRQLILDREAAMTYLRTGRRGRGQQRHGLGCPEAFDEAVELAKFDLRGRIPGGPAPELDEALDYLESLETAWD